MDTNITNLPLVSIMMTTYNREGFLSEAILSVLNQTYQNWELIILDDASTDNTAGVAGAFCVRDSRIKCLPSPINLGIAKNRNRGFAVAKGKYIAVLDSDDMWIDYNKLEKQVQFLEANPLYVVVGTNVKVIDSEGTKIGNINYQTEDERIRSNMLVRNQFTHSSVLIRASALVDKFYNPSFPIWEDYELLLRLGLSGKFANLPQSMTAYRKHNSNISGANKRLGAKAHLQVIKQHKNNYPHYWLAILKGFLRYV